MKYLCRAVDKLVINLGYKAVSLLWCGLLLGLTAIQGLQHFSVPRAGKGLLRHSSGWFSCTHADQAHCSQELLPQPMNSSGNCRVACPCCVPTVPHSMQMQALPALLLLDHHRPAAAPQIDLSLRITHPSGKRLIGRVLQLIAGKGNV